MVVEKNKGSLLLLLNKPRWHSKLTKNSRSANKFVIISFDITRKMNIHCAFSASQRKNHCAIWKTREGRFFTCVVCSENKRGACEKTSGVFLMKLLVFWRFKFFCVSGLVSFFSDVVVLDQRVFKI
jgi:hypothetical protein